MLEKRTKLWRREQGFRVFKKRMIYYASFDSQVTMIDGQLVEHPHWFELAKSHWTQVYKSTGTPCSCMLCQGERYNRLEYKRETRRILREAME